MCKAIDESVWTVGLLRDLKVLVELPISLACNNKVAQYIVVNLVFHNRAKFLDTGCYMVRTRIKKVFFKLLMFVLNFKLQIPSPSHKHPL